MSNIIPLTEAEALSLETANEIPPNYVRIRTTLGGWVWVDEQRYPQLANNYRTGVLTGGEAAPAGVYLRALPPDRTPQSQSASIPPNQNTSSTNTYNNTVTTTAVLRSKIKVNLTYPIKIRVNPEVTARQTANVQYQFQLKVDLIDVNISQPLISASFDFLNAAIRNYIDEERELKTLLNYGDDKQTVVVAQRYGQRDLNTVNTIQLKLLQPIPDEIQTQTPVFLSREVAKTVIDKIRVRFPPQIDTTPYLRPKNLGVATDFSLGKSLNNVTLKLLSLQTGSVGADDLYKNKTFEDEIFRKWYSYDFDSAELNLDFTDYNKFVFYGSATMRLQAFREKLKLIENIEYNRQQFLSSSVYSMQTSSAAAIFIQDKSAQYALEKENIIRSFDRYEQHLYFTSGSTLPYTASAWYADTGTEFNSSSYWPKIGNVIAPVYSPEVEEWFSTQLEIAQRYDEFNENNLINTIPTHVREHEENSPYITFVTMIGHFFDTLKPYVDHFPYIYDRGLDPNQGLSKDLINEIAEAVGFTMPTVNSIYNLADNILGTLEEEPRRDITAEVYKRLLHNLPFFVKSKGSRTSLLTLIKTLGFKNSLVTVRETGIASSGSFYIFDENSTGLYFSASTAVSSSTTSSMMPYIQIPMLNNPETLQLNLALDTNKITTIINSNNGWELLAVPHPSIPKIGRLELRNTSGSSSIITNYEEIFDNELFNIALRSTVDETSLRLIKTEGDDILFDSYTTESVTFNSAWQNTQTIYLGGIGTLYGNSSFVGTIDEFRLWNDSVSDEMILNTAFDPGSNAGDTYTSAVENLLVQLSFNKIDTDLLVSSSLLLNETSVPINQLLHVSASNISTGSIARFNRVIRQLVPTVGTTSYISNKIKLLEYPSNVTDVNGVKRLYRSKSLLNQKNKKVSRGKNRVVLANCPTEIVNQNIIRNFGIENINTALGVPTTTYKNFERSLERLKNYYNRYYYVDVDVNQYIRILSEVSSVLDQVVDYFIPSRAATLKGIVIEQSILEQTRVPVVRETRVYGNNSRKTLQAVGSLTGSRPDYSATYTVSGLVAPEPETTAKYTLLQAEMESTPVITATTSLLTSSVDVTENVILADMQDIKGAILTIDENVLVSNYTPINGTIESRFYDMNKIPYNDNNYGSVGAEPFDRIYPRKLLGLEIEKDRNGGTRSIYLPALYDIPPIADFRDLGVYTFFNHPEGVYKFPVIKKRVAYIRPLNQQWNYSTQQFEGITTWSFGTSYNLNDVVVQEVKVSETSSLNLQVILDARAGNKKYYAFKTRPSYTAPVDGTRFYSGSVPSYLPPSLDKDNWEVVRFTPEFDYQPRRVVFDTFTVPDPVLTNYKLTSVELESAIDFPNRFVDNYIIQNISGNSFMTGQIILQNIAALLAIQANTAGIRVRLYRTPEARDTDIYRPVTQAPNIDDGVLVDLSIDEENTAQIINPIVTLVSDSSLLEGKLYYTINNLTPAEKIGFVLSMYYFAIQIQRRVPFGYLRKHYRYFRDNSTSIKRRNYLGCKNTIDTTIDGLSPIQVFLSEGTDLIVAPTQTNEEIITGGGGQLNVT
jgi:hypothetical protein